MQQKCLTQTTVNRESGFTLIELLVTLAVLAVVLSLAIPSFKDMIANNRSTGLASELTTAVNFARSEAVKRVKRVTVCPSSNGTSCLTSSDWAKGWLVFVDKAGTDSAALEVETVLKYWDRLNPKTVVSLKKGVPPGGTAVEYLRFNAQGMLARAGASDTEQRFFEMYINGCKGESARRISIGLAGMVSTAKFLCP